jgi:Gly-Xaa carboxypeptidase
MGVLDAFDTLLEKNTPERTILARFRFDEDISGPQRAQFIARHLEETRGRASIDLIVDEGGLGIQEVDGATFALPGLGERVSVSQDTLM